MQGLMDEAAQQGEADAMNGHAAPGIQSTIPGFQVSWLSLPLLPQFDDRPCMHQQTMDCCALCSMGKTWSCCDIFEAVL